jgi:DNA-binding LytR/AlgR family response regulator
MSSTLPLAPNVQQLNESLNQSKKKRVRTRPSKKRITFDVEQVAYCVGCGNYTFIHFTDKKRLLVSYTLSVLIKQFGRPMFFRSHKSNAVNLNQVAKICTHKCEVTMLDGTVLKLSRRKITEVGLMAI